MTLGQNREATWVRSYNRKHAIALYQAVSEARSRVSRSLLTSKIVAKEDRTNYDSRREASNGNVKRVTTVKMQKKEKIQSDRCDRACK